MLRKSFCGLGVMATLGIALLSTTASAAPADGAAIRNAMIAKSELTTVGYYGSYYYPRYYSYHRYYYPRSYGYGY
jgi:hypothetical protein